MTFRFVEDHRHLWPVRLLCETLEVSPAGYYAWRGRPASAREQRSDALLVEIEAIHEEVKGRAMGAAASASFAVLHRPFDPASRSAGPR